MQIRRTVYLVFSFCAFITVANGQSLFNRGPFNPFQDTVKFKHLIYTEADYHVNSNAITNSFTYPFLFGGYIDNELKDQVSPRLSEQNRAGYQLSYGARYRYNRDSIYFFTAAINSRQFLTTGFTSDMFELVFRGNKPFAGEIAQLSPFYYTSFATQSVSLGAGKNLNDNFTVAAEVSVIGGSGFQQAVIERGSLYTEPDGAYIDLDLKYRLSFTENSQNFLNRNGLGLSAGIYASYSNEKFMLTANFTDIGFVRWKGLNHMKGDSSYRFEGKEIEDVLVLDNSVFSSFRADSLAKDLGFETRKKNKTYFLPTFFGINYVYYFSRKIHLYSGINFLANANYYPRVSIGPVLLPGSSWRILPVMSFGGFGKADFSLAVEKFFGKGFFAGANIFLAEALVSPENTAGHGIKLLFIKAF